MAMQQGGRGAAAPTAGARYYCLDYDIYSVNPNRSDEDIRKEIELTFVWDTWVNYDEVKIEVKNGIVTLSGTVSSAVSKRSAGDDAWDTIGVMDVVNNIKVAQPTQPSAPKQTRAQQERRRQKEPQPA